MHANNVGIKSIYEKPDKSDGVRVLVTQYWPRGISQEAVDEYLRVLAPSRALLHSFKDGILDWNRYSNQYLAEMSGEAQRAEIHRLAKVARSERVTVMCVCKDAEQCHRSLLRDLILRFDG
jgi:uncharacterized protein YeaO (DUF488 family)